MSSLRAESARLGCDCIQVSRLKRLFLILAMIGAWAEGWGDGPEVIARDTLVLGKISDDPRTDLEGMRPLIDWVVSQPPIAELGIVRGNIVMADGWSEMQTLIEAGRVDWITETIGSAVILSERTGADILLERWKYGEESYRSIVVVRADSGIHSLAELRGRTIAFEHPGSTTGFLVPALELYRRGLPIVLLRSPAATPPAGSVGYFFSGDEINTSTWVYRGSVVGGALADTDRDRPWQVPAAYRDELRIIFRSKSLPRAVEVFRADMNPELRARLIGVLLSMHESPTGLEVMGRFQQTTRFEPFEAEDWPYLGTLLPELTRMLESTR